MGASGWENMGCLCKGATLGHVAQHTQRHLHGVSRTQVGDRQLATLRPPLVKALYNESAEVAAMSDADVAAWRKERRIKLDNADLRPITAFSQSGR